MTTKRTRPDRRKAMTGKPPLNPKGRPQRKIEVAYNENMGLWALIVDDKCVYGDKDLLLELEKALTRNRKKPPKI